METVEPAWRRPSLEDGQDAEPQRLSKRGYEKELARLQVRACAPAGMDRPRGPEGRRDLRGPRHGRQGRDDQADYGEDEPTRCPPYERLFHDVMIGDHLLFTHADEVERLWECAAPLLADSPEPLPYEKGSWGPDAASALAAPLGWRLAEDGR